jgi:glutamyl-tRNA reductase
MNLLVVGCSYRTTPVEVRERLAFNDEQLTRALDDLAGRLGHEAVILSTCNRVELYVSPLSPPAADFHAGALDFCAGFHGLPCDEIRPHLYAHQNQQAVRHLFGVAASLDSMIVGEGQIAGQVKKAYERALQQGATGPLLNALFPHARRAARRVRSETGISQGSVSVSSAAVEYVKEVFDHFNDKTVLVIGAGKMGELTLKHLRNLRPLRILVTNRSPEKAQQVAAGCHGEAVPWERLDDVMAVADVVLSTTGAPEPIMTAERYARIASRRKAHGPAVILDVAVPRDFDPRINDGDRTFLWNIDDLKSIRERTLKQRRGHVGAAEAIVEEETARFLKDWARRRNGPLIDRLTQDADQKTQEIIREVLAKFNGKLSEADRQFLEKAFHRLKSKFLHAPISALREEPPHAPAGGGHTLFEAMRKLFRLQE